MAHPSDKGREMTPEKMEALRKIRETRKREEEEKKLRNAGIWLYGVAVLLAISALVTYAPVFDKIKYFILEFSIDAGSVVVFIGLGIWSRTKPYEAILTGLILFTLIIILGAVADPTSIIKGILWKVLIYSALIKGLSVAKQSKNNLANEQIIDDIDF